MCLDVEKCVFFYTAMKKKEHIAHATEVQSTLQTPSCECNQHVVATVHMQPLCNTQVACSLPLQLNTCMSGACATWWYRINFSAENRSVQQIPVVGRSIFSQRLIWSRIILAAGANSL